MFLNLLNELKKSKFLSTSTKATLKQFRTEEPQTVWIFSKNLEVRHKGWETLLTLPPIKTIRNYSLQRLLCWKNGFGPNFHKKLHQKWRKMGVRHLRVIMHGLKYIHGVYFGQCIYYHFLLKKFYQFWFSKYPKIFFPFLSSY